MDARTLTGTEASLIYGSSVSYKIEQYYSEDCYDLGSPVGHM